METLIVIPTYDESANLAWIVERILLAQPHVHVLVADDGSPDGTGDIADRLAVADPRVHVLHRASKQGLGAAYRAGFAWGLERDYELLLEMDADGSHRPEDLAQILAAAEGGADLVLGSRWVPGGSVVNWPLGRKLISRGGTLYARLMLGLPVHDVTGGFRAFRHETLRRLALDDVASQGYCFQIDMTRRVHAAGMTISEVPITFVERERGQSKMSGAIVREALWRVTAWGLVRLVPRALRRNPKDPGRGRGPSSLPVGD